MIHFSCDPDFYAMALSYEDRDRYEGDIHVLCPGWAKPGTPCECWCHGEEGERTYGQLRRRLKEQREADPQDQPEPSKD
jgi:hypothetical protein